MAICAHTPVPIVAECLVVGWWRVIYCDNRSSSGSCGAVVGWSEVLSGLVDDWRRGPVARRAGGATPTHASRDGGPRRGKKYIAIGRSRKQTCDDHGLLYQYACLRSFISISVLDCPDCPRVDTAYVACGAAAGVALHPSTVRRGSETHIMTRVLGKKFR